MRKISFIVLSFLLISGIYILIFGKEKISINKDYYLCRGGIIKKVNSYKNTEEVILNTNQSFDNKFIDLALGSVFSQHEGSIYFNPILNNYFFQYDMNKKEINKLAQGKFVAYSIKYKVILYSHRSKLYLLDTTVKNTQYLADFESSNDRIYHAGLVFISDDIFLFNNKGKVYQYDMKLKQTSLTQIKHCSIKNIYRGADNSILCQSMKSSQYYMLNLDTHKENLITDDKMIRFPFHYDKDLDILFYTLVELHITMNSLERHLTMAYDFKKNKHYIYHEKYFF